jgi:1,4-dihydroxy-2-naphthoate octaprenyltransferase
MSTAFLALRATRPAFLVLAPACVVLGAGAGIAAGGSVNVGPALAALLAALLAHASVNAFNEWSDFRSGLDLNTQRTPFSGGSGTLPARPDAAGPVLVLAVAALAGTLAAGAWLVMRTGPVLLPLGLLGVALVVTYTDLLNRNPWLCLFAPGAGFGLVIVAGVACIVAGGHTPQAWLAGLVSFWQVNNLLLLNQFPDAAADAAAGRRHLIIVHGERAGALTAFSLTGLAHATVLAAVAFGVFPGWSIAALVPASAAWWACHGALRHGRRIGEHPAYLAANVAATVGTPLVLGAMLAATA